MKRFWVVTIAALAAAPAALAATPPSALNYQGVLLSNMTSAPENGERDMIFHFYDAAMGGGEILIDKHTLADSLPVTVGVGLFNVQLGSGLVQDGSGVYAGDPYDSLAKMFRDFGTVYLGVEVRQGAAGGMGAFEMLTPRTRVVSAAYALNADYLDGKSSSDFLDTSSVAQTKAGSLTVSDLTASGNNITFGFPGASIDAFSNGVRIAGGDLDTDVVSLQAGNDLADGYIQVSGDNEIDFVAGNGIFQFIDGSTSSLLAFVDSAGTLFSTGNMEPGSGNVFLGFQRGAIKSLADTTKLIAGEDESDDLLLLAGNDEPADDDGRISLFGSGGIELRAGDGNFSFVNGASLGQTASLSPTGALSLPGPGASLRVAGVTGITGESRMRHSPTGSLGQAVGPLAPGGGLASFGRPGLILETDVGSDFEGAGIFLNGDSMALWSPGDFNRLLSIYDEDFLSSDPNSIITAEKAFIDGDGDIFAKGVLLTSSRSRKKNIAQLEGALDKALQLRGVRFDWKEADQGPDKPPGPAEPSIGFIAEEVASVYPELVAWQPDGQSALGLNYPALTAVAVEAIKELYALVEEQHPGITARRAGGAAVGSLASSPPTPPAEEAGTRTAAPRALAPVDPVGDAYARSFRPSSPELAASLPVSEAVELGDVLVVDRSRKGLMRRGWLDSDPAVVGIVAGRPGVLLGSYRTPSAPGQYEDDASPSSMAPQAERGADTALQAPVIFSGVTFCKVDAGYGSIHIGDLLTTSATPGHARRADEADPGTILGKALEPLEEGAGLVRVLVMLR